MNRMDELAEKVIDLLRAEGMTIGGAKLALERAVQLLEYEVLAEKKESRQ